MRDITDSTDITPDEWQLVDEKVGMLQYIDGEHEGKDYWAYIVVRLSKYEEYCYLVSEKQDIDLSDFGEIIEEGFGKEPPLEVKERIEREYASPEFNKLISKLSDKIINIESDNYES